METVVTFLMLTGLTAAVLGLFRSDPPAAEACPSCGGAVPPGYCRLDGYGRRVCGRCLTADVIEREWFERRFRGRRR